MTRKKDDGRELYEFKLTPHQLERLNRAAGRKSMSNKAFYAEEAKYVSEGGRRVLANPEYAARHEETKKLREQFKKYSGSPEVASDLLFEAKLKSDAHGKDFGTAAAELIDKMKGEHLEAPEEQQQSKIVQPESKSDPIPTRKLTFYQRFLCFINGYDADEMFRLGLFK